MESGLPRHESIAFVGLGGLGLGAASLFLEEEVEKVKLIDLDIVSDDTIYRSGFLMPGDSLHYKVDVMVKYLSRKYPWIKYTRYPMMLTERNFKRLLKDVDLIIDASNNLDTNLLSSYASLTLNLPLLLVVAGEGVFTAYYPAGTAPDPTWLEKIYNVLEGGYTLENVYRVLGRLHRVMGKEPRYFLSHVIDEYGEAVVGEPPMPEGYSLIMLGDTLFYTSDEKVMIDIESLSREVARKHILLRRGDSGVVFEYMSSIVGITYTGSALVSGVDDYDEAVKILRNFIDSIAYRYVSE